MLNLILIGSSGSGKSSTGNSIIGKRVFKASNNTGVISKSSFLKETDQTKTLSIIDGFDVIDCGEKADFDSIAHGLELSKEGITAFLFIIKYGERFSEEHCKVVTMTKKIFGNEVFTKFGICVLTCGDSYKEENRPKNVKKWFEKQSGELAELYKECDRRCVLFDNRTKIDTEKKEQVQKLKESINEIRKAIKRNYRINDFEEATILREGLTKQKRLIEEKTKCDKFIEDMKLQTKIALDNNTEADLLSVKEKLENYLKDFETTFNRNGTHADEIVIKLKTAIIEVKRNIQSFQETAFLNPQNTNAPSVRPKKQNLMTLKTAGMKPVPFCTELNAKIYLDVNPANISEYHLLEETKNETAMFEQDPEHKTGISFCEEATQIKKEINNLEGKLIPLYKKYIKVAGLNKLICNEEKEKLKSLEKEKLMDGKGTVANWGTYV